MEEEESSFGKQLVVEEFITAPKRATPTIPTSKGPGRTGGPRHDAGGLCSPGRWQPRLRKLPPRAGFIRDRMDAWIQTWSQQPANGGRIGKDKWQHLVYSCLLGRLAKDPFRKRLGQLDGEARNYLTEKQCPVSKTAGTGTEEIDFALRFPLGMRCEDPEPMKEFLGPGVRISVDTQPKRTSTVWPAKQRRALGEMDPASLQEFNDNFPSAREHAGLLQEDITELVKMGFMERITYGEAWKRFSKVSVAPLVVIVEETGQSRVLFDSSNYVQLNRQIKAQDIKVCHSAPDILGACSSMHWPRPIVSLVVDVSKAHRRVPVDERDWGLLACSESPRPRDPALLATWPILVNKVGTYGVASASWQWARAASLYQRLVYYIVEPPYLFRFADDLMLICWNNRERGFRFTRIVLRFLVFSSLVKMPFRWDKTRGGVQADFVGYFFDWENLVGGLSDKRAAWLANWARTTAAAGIAVGRDCRAALGRFSFSTTLLKHLLPFLGPIYAWAAVIEDSAAWPLPPALIIILKWLADQVEQRHLVSLVQSTPVRAGLRFKADARAEGDTVIVGGYELPDGCNDLKKVRWFSYRLDTTNAPWAFERHRQAFRAIAALDLYASLLCLVLFAPCFDNKTQTELVLQGTTDNQSNEALVNRCLTTKYPSYVILLELTEQMTRRKVSMDLRWQPRNENQHADDLTNEAFGNFCSALRITTPLAELPWIILPRLVEAAAQLHKELAAKKVRLTARRDRATKAHAPGKRKSGLRFTDPW